MIKLAFNYAAFACIAIIANILSQDLFTRIYHGSWAVALSVLVGTGVGLVVKYVLDKQYIFRFKPANRAEDGRAFVLYAVMGLITTAIFWGFEFAFDYLFDNKTMRYVGGIIGLVIGYISKYQLDKRYVFRGDSR